MFNRIKKIFIYIRDYKKNRELSRMFQDRNTFPLVAEQYKLCIKYSNDSPETEEETLSKLVILGHSIEKGLASRNFRPGFGQSKLTDIIKLCNKYLDTWEDRPSRLAYVIGILKEYEYVNINNNFSLPSEMKTSLDKLYDRFMPAGIPETMEVTRDLFFRDVPFDFAGFAASRHSVRDFTGDPINPESMQQAFRLAQTAPSACNRQSTRVYCIYSKTLRTEVALMQNNGPGFVEMGNPILVIASELQDWGAGEQWYGCYIDAGIYIMNLLYSLHSQKIAAIPLNWYATLEKNKRIHTLLNIPESQIVVAVIACGQAEEHFKLVTSERRDSNEIVKFVM